MNNRLPRYILSTRGSRNLSRSSLACLLVPPFGDYEQTYLYALTPHVRIGITNFIRTSRVLHNNGIRSRAGNRRPADLEITGIVASTQ